ncbi:TYR3-like protein [Mya arenaria]|uniref:TYR3-like protein n=1 Tax=Mya arenaria TaxID=6604 RepID=A0ABY7EV09_MYAAR|nr:TYR3-like protein [Mya arenaria]
MAALAIATFILIFVSNSFATTDFDYVLTLPENVQTCFDNSANLAQVDHKLAKDACIRAYFSQILEPSIRDEDYLFFKTEFEDTRYGFHGPPTGFRRRIDIRTLSRQDRKAVFDVFQALYELSNRIYFVHSTDSTVSYCPHNINSCFFQNKTPFAKLILFSKDNEIVPFYGGDGSVSNRMEFWVDLEGCIVNRSRGSIKEGLFYLGTECFWQRKFEEEMRKIDPDVSLPYWDYTMDYYIPSPATSVVRSSCFFGNGVGLISSGPFAGWSGGYNIEIQRDLAKPNGQCTPRLIDKADIKGVMDFRQYQFSVVAESVFWMHHAFIDYIWEQFRQNQQQSNCNIDPETDYPNVNLAQDNNTGHARDDPMQAFEHLRNIDGMWNNWTTDFYSYEPQPQCPDCGNSTYLYCDKCIDSIRFPSGVCVSKQISDCKERGRRSAPNLTPLHHKACHGKFVIVGMQGDGRDRHNTDAENWKILSAFIGTP